MYAYGPRRSIFNPTATPESVVANLSVLESVPRKVTTAANKANNALKNQYKIHKKMGKHQAAAYNRVARKHGWHTHAHIIKIGDNKGWNK